MTLDEYTRLADDGCPNCPGHVDVERGWYVQSITLGLVVECGWKTIRVTPGDFGCKMTRNLPTKGRRGKLLR